MGRGRECEGLPPNPCATGRAVRSRRGAARACARETAAGCSRVVSPLAPVEGSGDGALRPSPRSGRAGKRSGERGRGAESGGEEQKAGERSGDAALRRTGAMMGGGGGGGGGGGDLLVRAGLDVDAARRGAEDADEVVLHAVLDGRHPRLLRARAGRCAPLRAVQRRRAPLSRKKRGARPRGGAPL